jgi:hypothetical protein
MTTNETIMIIAVTFIAVGIPVTGLVIRFALRPLVKDIAAAIRGRQMEEGNWELIQRLERIEMRLVEQSRHTGELLEANRFYGELQASRIEEPRGPSAGG